MSKITRILSPMFAAAGLVACGGAGTTQDFRAAAPTLEKLAISQNDGDPTEEAASASPSASVAAPAGPECHPHLFVRTHEIIGRVNRHFFKHLHHVEELIRNNPLTDGETKTWEDVRGGLDRKFSMTRTANLDGSVTYTFELDIAPAAGSGTPAFVKVLSGLITHVGPVSSDADAGAGELVENKGTVTFDFTALASVLPRERARGQITDAFDNVHDR